MPTVNAKSSSDGGSYLESEDPVSGTEPEAEARVDASDGGEEEEGDAEGAALCEYARSLGIDPDEDQDLLWVARQALATPLPPGWTDHSDPEGRVYFCNQMTQESSWFHPTDVVFQEVVALVKALRSERPQPSEARRSAALRDHLVLAHQDAQEHLDGWSGPYDSEQGPYYYNRQLDISSWDDPVEARERELAVRQDVLRRCLLSEWPGCGTSGSASVGAPVASTGALRRGPSAAVATLGLEAPRPGKAPPRSPSSARSFYTARSGCSGRSGRSLTPCRPPSRPSPLPGRSPAGSPSQERDASFGPSSREPEASGLRSLLKPVRRPSAEAPSRPSTPPKQSRSPERSPVQPREASPAPLPAWPCVELSRPPAQQVPEQPAPEALPAPVPAWPCVELPVPPASQPREQPPAPEAAPSETLPGGVGGGGAAPASAQGAKDPSSTAASLSSGGAGAKDPGRAAPAPAQGAKDPGRAAPAPAQGAKDPGRAAPAPAQGAQEFDVDAAITSFAGDASRQSLELPPGLSADQRKRAKKLVEQHPGLTCESFGFGAERRMHVFREKPPAPKDEQHRETADKPEPASGATEADKPEPASGAAEADNADIVEFTFGKADSLQIPRAES